MSCKEADKGPMTDLTRPPVPAATTQDTLAVEADEPKYTKWELLAIFLGALIVLPVGGAVGVLIAIAFISYF